MWYEILPGLGLMVGCIAAVGGINYTCQKLGNGGKLRRQVRHPFEYRLYRRDQMVTGKAYIAKGLEGLNEMSFKS
ncbi:NADH dehydrogenase [ubiquinone] 1 alpha subcomplex subunit 1-like [Patiria miniata]|uniref:NADH dehydrogenase [ubiquinone] 1 alpha subcomplex subunit 1 n=1 Tax=Patiria miniata TaxID=46514 RepID=A0A913ZH49_PATMI|nr:NADH dehydrogenase [ubiquinone] 1 alpha subcomplex subunit 1-like [Patiria miniata]